MQVAFYTVSNSGYFTGTVALVNSLRLVGHDQTVYVADCGLDREQRERLASVVTLVEGSDCEAPHYAKVHAPLEYEADVMVLLDSDMAVLRRLDDIIARAARGSIVAFADPIADRFDERWGELLDLGTLQRQPYLNSGALFLPREPGRRVLERVMSAQEVVDLESTQLGSATTAAEPFYFLDQDIWNAVLSSNVAAGKVVVLPSRLAPHPPFKDNGDAPFMLHHVGAKPWLRHTRWNLYAQLLPQLLLEPDLPLRLEAGELPLRLRRGGLAAIARLYSDGFARLGFFRGRLGIRRRLDARRFDKSRTEPHRKSRMPSKDNEVVSRRVGDEVVLVNLETNRIFSLNATAARFWELLQDGVARPRIEERLLAEFRVEPAELTREIDGLLAELRAEGLVADDAA